MKITAPEFDWKQLSSPKSLNNFVNRGKYPVFVCQTIRADQFALVLSARKDAAKMLASIPTVDLHSAG